MPHKLRRALPRTFQRMHCGVKLQEIEVTHFPDAHFPRPLRIFQCSVCMKRAMAFAAPVTALVVWSDEWRHQFPFKDFLERKMERHERKHRVRERMYVEPVKRRRKNRRNLP